jgi:hypothetical protein
MGSSIPLLFLGLLTQVECRWPSQNQTLTSAQEFDILADQYYVDQDHEKVRELERSDAAKENLKFYVAMMAETAGVSENPEEEGGAHHGLTFENMTTVPTTTTPRIPLPPELKRRKETYDEGIERLKCDNPWFWNSFECVWLDVKNQNIIQRTKMNAKTAGIFLGVVAALFAIPCCSCISK